MHTKEVKSRSDWRDFHRVARYVYARDPHWVAPLEKDIEKVFNAGTNKTLRQGEAALWVLYDDERRPIGRIAAFIDHGRNQSSELQLGGLGFFECVRGQDAAHALLGKAEDWLQARGVQAIDGPINFGERDKFWGLLERGWAMPLYHENYNPPYYLDFFSARGYEPHEQIFTFRGTIRDSPWERNARLAAKVRKRYGVQSRIIDMKNLDQEARHMTQVYNEAFSGKPYFKPLETAQVREMLRQMEPVIDPGLFCLAFAEGKPVGFCALMPELNPLLKFADGKLPWWKIPRFWWNKRFARPQLVKGVAFGIHPDYQRRGVFAEIVDFLYHHKNERTPRKYESIYLATIRGNNLPMIQSVGGALGVRIERVHVAYRKLLDPNVAPDPLDFMPVDDVARGRVPDASVYPAR